MARKPRDLAERFWSKVNKQATGCWKWTASTTRQGYGRIIIARRVRRAHVVAYELTHGAVPAGLVIDHLCRNRQCVNPTHLEAVTFKENILRGTGPTAVNKRKTECYKGHPLSGDNLRVNKDGTRTCRTCWAAHQRAFKLRQKAKAA